MMLTMTTTAEFSDASMRHELSVIIRGYSGIHPSFRMCPSYLLASPLVSGGVRMEEGDAAASVVWPGGVGSLLMGAGAVLVFVALPYTPCQEVHLETHRSLILAGSLSSAMLVMAPLTDPTAATTNQAAG